MPECCPLPGQGSIRGSLYTEAWDWLPGSLAKALCESDFIDRDYVKNYSNAKQNTQ